MKKRHKIRGGSIVDTFIKALIYAAVFAAVAGSIAHLHVLMGAM